jgi:hypothetical protein
MMFPIYIHEIKLKNVGLGFLIDFHVSKGGTVVPQQSLYIST